MIELGAWTPDQPSVSNAGLKVAYNTIPATRGYDAMPSLLTAAVGTLDSACRGALTGRSRNGTNFTVGGSATRLYLATTGALANVSNGGGSPYTIAAGNWWDFVLYGNRIIASDHIDAPQSFVLGTSANFAALSADAPNAKHLAVVRDFVVAGNIVGRGANAATIGTAEDAIQWSALDDPTLWPQVGTSAARSVQSDWQPLAGNGGQVTDIIGGSDYGIVFQERSIWRMDYEGGDTFFRLTPIDENRGCWIHKAAIRVGGVTYFPAEDGFMATDGMQTVPIGNGIVDKFFLDQFDNGYQSRLSVAYFSEWKCIMWLFMGPFASGGIPNTFMLFNVQSQGWAYGSLSAEWLVSVLPFTASLDDDATSLDSGTYSAISLDILIGAVRRAAGAFDSTHGLSTFSNTKITGVFETNEFEPDPGNVGTILSLRPVYDNVASAQVLGAIKYRMRVSDSQLAQGSVLEDETGKIPLRATGRYLSASFILTGDYKNFSGFDVNVVTRGGR